MSSPPDHARHLAETVERLARLVRAREHESALNPAQWEALRYLARCNRFSNTPGALTRYLAATKGTVSQTLIALERKGLVRKEPDPASGRSVRLFLTETGERLLADDPLGLLAEAAATLAGPMLAGTATGLGMLLAATIARNGGRPFGVCRTCRFFRPEAPEGAPHFCGLLLVPLSERDSLSICQEHEPPQEPCEHEAA
ncbi:MarR family winged helix-turn-helix transcriptional regulator [Chelatococcus sp. SYSU_G07232]|uniref:MarR family winged helix-turn-helix transcriptional regulator n=1 Tax=Chelatococcus albus TaxID=3047466 RepID=A0ABT7AJI5_9HYPH|nr:MarR family winged helix-turn-helix transcriptional regulator [Chelatococcus sp. SYSU_G07232]MDJ1159531.1 MarR family winged helix-turn-helix transcriptional regulator [Chelatococcus sp. SYSU_G07232]